MSSWDANGNYNHAMNRTSWYLHTYVFFDPDTNVPYQGYYYETNGVFFTGREFNANAPKIIKKENENKYLNDPKIATYAKLTGLTSQQLSTPSINIISNSKRDTFPPTNQASGPPPLPLTTLTQFFIQKINVNPIIIKKVDEKSYLSVQGNPLYKTTFTGTYNNISQTIDQANIQMPGLRTFLGG